MRFNSFALAFIMALCAIFGITSQTSAEPLTVHEVHLSAPPAFLAQQRQLATKASYLGEVRRPGDPIAERSTLTTKPPKEQVVYGYVYNDDGYPIPYAFLQLTKPYGVGRIQHSTASTDQNGRYELRPNINLDLLGSNFTGSYLLEVDATHYQNATPTTLYLGGVWSLELNPMFLQADAPFAVSVTVERDQATGGTKVQWSTTILWTGESLSPLTAIWMPATGKAMSNFGTSGYYQQVVIPRATPAGKYACGNVEITSYNDPSKVRGDGHGWCVYTTARPGAVTLFTW